MCTTILPRHSKLVVVESLYYHMGYSHLYDSCCCGDVFDLHRVSLQSKSIMVDHSLAAVNRCRVSHFGSCNRIVCKHVCGIGCVLDTPHCRLRYHRHTQMQAGCLSVCRIQLANDFRCTPCRNVCSHLQFCSSQFYRQTRKHRYLRIHVLQTTRHATMGYWRSSLQVSTSLLHHGALVRMDYHCTSGHLVHSRPLWNVHCVYPCSWFNVRDCSRNIRLIRIGRSHGSSRAMRVNRQLHTVLSQRVACHFVRSSFCRCCGARLFDRLDHKPV